MASRFLSLFVLVLCSPLIYSLEVDLKTDRASKIIGGHLAPEKAFPFIVSIVRGKRHSCGGTLVNDRQVITAGHCATAPSPPFAPIAAALYSIRANSLNATSGGQVIQVKKVTVHPEYGRESMNTTHVPNDIAIFDLAERVINAKPARLPFDPENETTEGENVTTAGWGRTHIGYSPDMLWWATVQAWDKDACRESYKIDVPESIICANVEGGGIDSCQGDSGGPAIEGNNTLVGIVSSGKGCGDPDYPGLYTRVLSHKRFIEKHLT